MKKKSVLHLGCGKQKIPGSVGVDNNPRVKPDVVHNLNKFPYPFSSNRFDEIIAENIIEHLDNVIKAMEEIHRLAKPNAKIIISMGHFTSVDSFTDPTHKHFFTSRSFDYLIPGTDLYKYGYSKAKFKKTRVTLGPLNYPNPLVRLILALINKHPVLYESRFAFLFPVGSIQYELVVLK